MPHHPHPYRRHVGTSVEQQRRRGVSILGRLVPKARDGTRRQTRQCEYAARGTSPNCSGNGKKLSSGPRGAALLNRGVMPYGSCRRRKLRLPRHSSACLAGLAIGFNLFWCSEVRLRRFGVGVCAGHLTLMTFRESLIHTSILFLGFVFVCLCV